MYEDRLEHSLNELRANLDQDIHFLSVGGSFCYGTQGSNSDVDLRGFYVLPNRAFGSLFGVDENISYQTDVIDASFHELKKFALLAMGANPNVLEPLFYASPLVHPAAEPLVANREMFLSKRIAETSLGYARSQWGKLMAFKDKDRYPKYLQHLFRLLFQAHGTLQNGIFDPRVSKIHKRYLDQIQEEPISHIFAELERIMESIEEAMENSPLPDAPDKKQINELVLECRQYVE